MKTKVKKIKSATLLQDRLKGLGTWRITRPCKATGKRLTYEFYGTRAEAEIEADMSGGEV